MLGLRGHFGRKLWMVLSVCCIFGTLGVLYYRDIKLDFAIDDVIKTDSGDDTLDTLGYRKAKGNVDFKYLNSKGISGTREEVIQRNKRVYENLATRKMDEPKDYDIESIRPPEDWRTYDRALATILCLVRNQEILKITRSIQEMELHFNKDFGYPYTFINDQPFSQRFIDHVQKFTDAEVEFVVIDPELWDKPDFIDKQKEKEGQELLVKENVMYAKMASYHNMCRFFSGNFYKIPELQKYKYYWRLEPNIQFYSDVKYDVFKYLQGTGKVYGFTMALYDIEQSITTLWQETLKYLNIGDNYKYINPNGAFQWLTENLQNPHKTKHAGYSTCHFWSNFEIGSFDFWKLEAYDNYFKHLDSTGNFYYERWGDAPVHSVGLSLFADKSKIHWFRDIGYYHDPYQHCPNLKNTNGCIPGAFANFEANSENCMANWIDYELGDQVDIY